MNCRVTARQQKKWNGPWEKNVKSMFQELGQTADSTDVTAILKDKFSKGWKITALYTLRLQIINDTATIKN